MKIYCTLPSKIIRICTSIFSYHFIENLVSIVKKMTIIEVVKYGESKGNLRILYIDS